MSVIYCSITHCSETQWLTQQHHTAHKAGSGAPGAWLGLVHMVAQQAVAIPESLTPTPGCWCGQWGGGVAQLSSRGPSPRGLSEAKGQNGLDFFTWWLGFKGKSRNYKVSLGLCCRIPEHHFYDILLVKTSQRVCLDSKSWPTDLTAMWVKQHTLPLQRAV